MTVAVLFAREDSHYKAIDGCDVWDAERDALKWPGGVSCIAHPPCRAWGSLRHFAKPRPGEKELALWAVERVRQFGGVLEHPLNSTLWPVAGLPPAAREGGKPPRDQWGGWTLIIWQSWFGHRADKPTRLYIVGCEPDDIPRLPMRLGFGSHLVSPRAGFRKGMPGWRPSLETPEREHTPPDLVDWLVELARRCRVQEVA